MYSLRLPDFSGTLILNVFVLFAFRMRRLRYEFHDDNNIVHNKMLAYTYVRKCQR